MSAGRLTAAAASAINVALLSRQPIPGLEVTELPPAEAAIQWRLAVALQGNNPARDFENTRPMWEVL